VGAVAKIVVNQPRQIHGFLLGLEQRSHRQRPKGHIGNNAKVDCHECRANQICPFLSHYWRKIDK